MHSKPVWESRLRRSRLLSIPRQIHHITPDVQPGRTLGPTWAAESALDQEKLVSPDPLAGELPDHGGIQEGVAVRVANLLPFLVLKAFAIDERDKAKGNSPWFAATTGCRLCAARSACPSHARRFAPKSAA
jgi:hypothetical protein